MVISARRAPGIRKCIIVRGLVSLMVVVPMIRWSTAATSSGFVQPLDCYRGPTGCTEDSEHALGRCIGKKIPHRGSMLRSRSPVAVVSPWVVAALGLVLPERCIASDAEAGPFGVMAEFAGTAAKSWSGPLEILFWGGLAAAFFYNNYVDFDGPLAPSNFSPAKSKATVSHILLATETECDQILRQIEDRGGGFGAFTELAKERSRCPSKKNGGSLGSIKQGEMVPEFDSVCFDSKTRLQQIVGPVKSKFGVHLMWLQEREFIK